jgi:DNA-binding beta-propeller fold protein YncE
MARLGGQAGLVYALGTGAAMEAAPTSEAVMHKRLLVALLAVILATALLPATVGAQPPPYLTQWGTLGTGNGQFNVPMDVAVDGSGNVYVADMPNNRIQVFSSDGTYVTQWGTSGSGDGQFLQPYGVAVDASGNVYVAEIENHRIQKFTSSGTYVTQWGSYGTGNGQFSWPIGVAVDTSGNVYVAENVNHRIQKFTSSGTYVTQWGTLGTGDGQFKGPRSVAVDASGNVYVADNGNVRIQAFTSDGTYLTQWGTLGTGDGQFDYPCGVAVDASGNVYVADAVNHRIQVFTSSGTYVTQWGSYGTGNGQFQYPYDVAVDGSRAYVADGSNHRIQVFDVTAVPVLVSLASADVTADGVKLAWFMGGSESGSATVYRSPVGGDWARIGEITADGTGYLRYTDPIDATATRVGYRLGIIDGGIEGFYGETWVDLPAHAAALAFALDPVRPNPSRGGALTVHFSLPTDAPARLELLDVAGRRIATHEVGIGQHTLDFGADQHLAPGLYLVRLKQGANTRTTRVAVLR